MSKLSKQDRTRLGWTWRIAVWVVDALFLATLIR